MPLSAAEKQKRYRERLKNKTECYEEAKRKQRERYHRNKRLVKDLTRKEKFNANVIWRLRKRELRRKKQNIERVLQHTPPSSPLSESRFIPLDIQNDAPPSPPPPQTISPQPTSQPSQEVQPEASLEPANSATQQSASLLPIKMNVDIPNNSAKQRGRKKVKRDRAKVCRENVKLTKDNVNLKKRCEKYKKRYLRKIDKEKLTKPIQKDDDKYTILSKAIKNMFKSAKSRKERLTIKKIFTTAEIQTSRLKKKLLMENLGVDKIIKEKACFDRVTLLKKKIKEFFLRDDITRASAGKKETLTKQKVTVQKRYLLDCLKNLYKTFKTENPELKCSYFYFCRNKPFFVVRPSVDAREMCMCKLHVNFAYKANALKKRGIIGTDHPSLLINATVCDVNSKDCMYGICNKCKNQKNIYNSDKIDGTIKWTEWIRKEEKFQKDEKMIKAVKNVREEMSENVNDFITRYEKDLAVFKKHVFNIKSQFKNFRQCLEKIRPNECMILVDFSENYNCKYHQEIQHHHFGGSRNQISLHTVVVYTYNYETGEGHEVHTFCTVSASSIHQPAAIWIHLDPILKLIRTQFVCVNTVHFFSDGPSTQYRQKQNFYLTCTKLFDYGFEYMTWSFFEAGHGKGPADGVGGFLKRTADKIVANGEDIADVDQFFYKLKDISKIKLFLIDEKDITEQQKILPSNIPRLLGTLKVHQIFSDCYGILQYRELSCFCEEEPSGKRGFCMCLDPKTYDVRTVIPVIENLDNEDGVSIHFFPEMAFDEVIPTTAEVIDSSDDDSPLIALKISKELQDITNTGHKKIYKDIYGSSSDDEQPCSSYDKENSRIGNGDFLLVNVYVDVTKTKVKTYKYVCKALSDIEDDGEIKVMFLRVVDKNAKRFRLDERDVSYVDYKDVIEKLPNPEIVKRGYRTYYEFKFSVGVFEK